MKISEWKEAIASERGPASSTTRFVLLALGFHLEYYDGQIPSIETLCGYTRLKKRTVTRHLKIAEETGWLRLIGGDR